MLNKIKYVLLSALLVLGLQAIPAYAAEHSLGSNIIGTDGTVYTITTQNGQTVRAPYTSSGAFLSYSFNTWDSIVGVSAEDMALPVGTFIPPQNGKVICSDRGADKGTCYLITNGQKAGFTSASVFTGLGYSFSNVMSGDVSFLPSTSNVSSASSPHDAGSLINKNGTIYLVGNNGLIGLPSWSTLQSWGYTSTDIVPANSADDNLPIAGILPIRQPQYLQPSTDNQVSNTPNSSPTPTPAPASSMTPTTPTVNGPSSVQAGTSANYYFVSTDQNSGGYNGGLITYTVNWGDGSAVSSSSALPSGSNYSASHTWATSGTYNITVTATPGLGNPVSGTYQVLVYASAATMSPATPTISGPSTIQTSTAGNYSFTSTDQNAGGYNGGLIVYAVNWGDGSAINSSSALASGASYNVSHTWSAAGTYTITVTATPGLGSPTQTTYQVQVSGTVMTTSNPTVSGSSSVQQGVAASYSFTSTDQNGGYNGGLISYAVNWGDGIVTNSSSGLPSGVSYSASHTWSTAGNYTITVTATPGLGSIASGTYQVTVYAPASSMAPTTPNISGPSTTQAGVADSYTFTSTDQSGGYNGGSLSYSITWGDGSPASYASGYASGSGYTVSHTWATAGTYTITVTVTPGQGSVTNGSYQVMVH